MYSQRPVCSLEEASPKQMCERHCREYVSQYLADSPQSCVSRMSRSDGTSGVKIEPSSRVSVPATVQDRS
ncbi:hypothetical protein BD626DRAFT_27512 [Schizophyllum amplum]|uniref:Uncharacterized protein n=1 Tax=Schizophyllum amplum TaxID=97359 RepID=A0A550CZZ3_9AGAR|nr:hypothetical protein BD626DRAFT_27512 [Auriculariopsis ampla]